MRHLPLTLLLACACGLPPSCTTPPTAAAERAFDGSKAAVAAAEKLADAEQFEQAHQVLARAISDTDRGTPARGLLDYTTAWLYRQQAQTLPEDDRVALLKLAETSYEAVIRDHPGLDAAVHGLGTTLIQLREYDHGIAFFQDVIDGGRADDRAAGAAWLAIGDLHRSRNQDGDVPAALESYRRAFELGDADAAMRIVSLDGIRREELRLFCRRFAQQGAGGAALAGLERLMAGSLNANRGDEASSFCVNWLQVAGHFRLLDEARIDGLPAAPSDPASPCRAIDALRQLLQDLKAGKLDGFATGELADDRRPEYARQVGYWSDSTAHRHALAVGLRSLAESYTRKIQPQSSTDAVRRAAALYELALEFAPRDYVPQPLLDPDHPDTRLAIAIDLAVFYNNHRTLAGSGQRVRRLLAPGAPLNEADFRAGSHTDPERTRYFGLLGLVFADAVDRPRWLSGSDERAAVEEVQELARRYLRAAIEASPGHVPLLRHQYARVLAQVGRHRESVDAAFDATRDYFGIENPSGAYRAGDAGIRVGYSSAATIEDRTIALEDYLYPDRGFYLGGSFGLTDANESSASVARDINGRQPGRAVDVDLDDTDEGFKAFLGYRFAAPIAVELGYVDLGAHRTRISAATIDPNLGRDVLAVHPVTGRGASLSLLVFPFEYERFSLFGKVGGWYWRSDIDITVGNQRLDGDFDDFDIQAGVGLQYRLSRSCRARAEYERYLLDDHEVDMLSVGLLFTF